MQRVQEVEPRAAAMMITPAVGVDSHGGYDLFVLSDAGYTALSEVVLMSTTEATAVRRDADDLARVVDGVVERLPASDLAALHELLKRTLEEARRLEAARTTSNKSGLVPIQPAPEQLQAYFPVTASPHRVVSRKEMAEADRSWAAAFERGHSYRDAALRDIGPVLTPAKVAARLGVSAVTVNNWRRRKRLLAFRFDEHQYLYPAFQFVDHPEHGERGVLRQLDAVLVLLPFRAEWARVQFFLTPSPALSGRTPLDVLRRGDEHTIERLKKVAAHADELGN
jgi:hypothetical protein